VNGLTENIAAMQLACVPQPDVPHSVLIAVDSDCAILSGKPCGVCTHQTAVLCCDLPLLSCCALALPCCACLVAVVQRMVLQHIKPETILVGHALENDLKALRVSALQAMSEQAAVLATHCSLVAEYDGCCQQCCSDIPCGLVVAHSGTVSLHPQSVCVGSG
jgi:hypothetical protein